MRGERGVIGSSSGKYLAPKGRKKERIEVGVKTRAGLGAKTRDGVGR